jgi:hypothetical protein
MMMGALLYYLFFLYLLYFITHFNVNIQFVITINIYIYIYICAVIISLFSICVVVVSCRFQSLHNTDYNEKRSGCNFIQIIIFCYYQSVIQNMAVLVKMISKVIKL